MNAQLPQQGCSPSANRTPVRLLNLVDVAALVLLATFLEFSAWTGRVRLFVASMYVWLPAAAGAVLFAMALARLSSLLRAGTGCGCSVAHSHRAEMFRVFYAAVLLIPVGTSLVVDPQQFSADGVRKRRAATSARDPALDHAMAWVLGQAQVAQRNAAPFALPAEPTVRDLIEAVERGESAALEGRFLTLIGQCSPTGNGNGRRFDLYRMLVTCCIADAQSLSLEVVASVPEKLDYGQWLRVGGVLRFDAGSGLTLPVLHAAKIERIPLPARPYL